MCLGLHVTQRIWGRGGCRGCRGGGRGAPRERKGTITRDTEEPFVVGRKGHLLKIKGKMSIRGSFFPLLPYLRRRERVRGDPPRWLPRGRIPEPDGGKFGLRGLARTGQNAPRMIARSTEQFISVPISGKQMTSTKFNTNGFIKKGFRNSFSTSAQSVDSARALSKGGCVSTMDWTANDGSSPSAPSSSSPPPPPRAFDVPWTAALLESPRAGVWAVCASIGRVGRGSS